MSVVVGDERSVEDHAVDIDRLRRLATVVLDDQGVPEIMDTTILLVDGDRMTQLNEQHMAATGPTDVLAFPLDDPAMVNGDRPALLGDVIICPSVAASQAGNHGGTTQSEIELLTVHGILHLLGHDHADPGEKAVMFGLTDRLLADFASVAPTPTVELA